MRTFATIGIGNTFRGSSSGTLVGRLVANTTFVEALFAHSRFDRFLFLIGEHRERRNLHEAFVETGLIEEERFDTADFRALPRLLADDAITVLHHGEPAGRGLDLAWYRDRHARRTVPVTGQVHSLSYPRSLTELLRLQVLPLGPSDAIFCSSREGRAVFDRSVEAVSQSLQQAGAPAIGRQFQLPLLPLGIHAATLGTGDRDRGRKRLGISTGADVALCMGRFTEYDKMDLVPLLRTFARVRALRAGGDVETILVLAGATQGTGSVGALEAWTRLLGLEGAVIFRTDFPETEKADLLAAADVFVSPVDNPQETFGLSVVEALAAGLPVICSDYDGYKDTVTSEVGWRIPTTWGGPLETLSEVGPIAHEAPLHLALGQSLALDPVALESAFLEAFDDLGGRMSRSAAARLRALERYDWSSLVPRYEAVWDELLEVPTDVERARAPREHPMRMDFRRIFAGYPTTFLAPDSRVATAELGEQLLEAGVSLPIHSALASFFSPDLTAATLHTAQGGVRVEDLREAISTSPHASLDHDADLLIAWLLKHGALNFQTTEASRDARDASHDALSSGSSG